MASPINTDRSDLYHLVTVAIGKVEASKNRAYAKCDEALQNCYIWIDEALTAAKGSLDTNAVMLIPKTPSAKNNRRMKRPPIDESMEAFEDEPTTKRSARNPKKKKRSSTTQSTSTRALRATRRQQALEEGKSESPIKSLVSCLVSAGKEEMESDLSVMENKCIPSTSQESDFSCVESGGNQVTKDNQETVREKAPTVSPVKTINMLSDKTKKAVVQIRDDIVRGSRSPSGSPALLSSQSPLRTVRTSNTPNRTAFSNSKHDAILGLVKDRVSTLESSGKKKVAISDLSPHRVPRLCHHHTPPRPASPRTPSRAAVQHTASKVSTPNEMESVHTRFPSPKPSSGSDSDVEPSESCSPEKKPFPESQRTSSHQGSSLRSSIRHIGTRISLSKKRTSAARHILRKSKQHALAVEHAKLKHLENIMSPKKSPIIAPRCTRSKMRANKDAPPSLVQAVISPKKITTPEVRSTRSKLRLNKVQAKDQSDSETGTPGSDLERVGAAAALSTMAPVRSTRSKMRKLKEQEQDDSPSAMYIEGRRESTGKRPRSHSDDDEASYNKQPRLNNHSPSHPSRQSRAQQQFHASSFLNNLQKKSRTSQQQSTTITSFIQRNTPSKKLLTQDIMAQRKKDLLYKESQGEDRRKRREALLQKQAEEKKKMREQRQLQVAQRREDHERKEQEQLRNNKLRMQDKQQVTSRILSEKQKEEKERQRLRDKKLTEAEARRKQDDEMKMQRIQEKEEEQRRHDEVMAHRKEIEEQERLQRIQEQKHQERERLAMLEKEKERQRQQAVEYQRKKEAEVELRRQKEEKERRERIEKERREKERHKQIELERQKEEQRHRQEQEAARKAIELRQQQAKNNMSVNMVQTVKPLNVISTVNTSYTVDKPKVQANGPLNDTYTKPSNSDSYDITPHKAKVLKPSTEHNYDISDMHSDDSTDDDTAPKKKVPAWASGTNLRAALIGQSYNMPDLDVIFGTILEPDLNTLFVKKKSRFNKRTSSAVWATPLYSSSGQPV